MNNIMIKASTVDKVVVVELKFNGAYLIDKYPLRKTGQFPLIRIIRGAMKLYKMDIVKRVHAVKQKLQLRILN